MAKKRKAPPLPKKRAKKAAVAAKKTATARKLKAPAARGASKKEKQKKPKKPLTPKALAKKGSAAAKKGWRTRRKARQIAPSPEVVQTAESAMVEAVKKFGRAEILRQFAMIKSDGTRAKEPSILRHMPQRDNLLERLRETAEEEADEEGWILESDRDVAATDSFRAEALRIKREFSLEDVREVYTLFFST